MLELPTSSGFDEYYGYVLVLLPLSMSLVKAPWRQQGLSLAHVEICVLVRILAYMHML